MTSPRYVTAPLRMTILSLRRDHYAFSRSEQQLQIRYNDAPLITHTRAGAPAPHGCEIRIWSVSSRSFSSRLHLPAPVFLYPRRPQLLRRYRAQHPRLRLLLIRWGAQPLRVQFWAF